MSDLSTFKPKPSAILIFLGYFLGTQIALLPLVLIFKDWTHTALFQFLLYIITFLSPILAYYFLKMKPKNQKYEWNWKISSISDYLLIFPLYFSMLFVSDYFVSLIPTEGPILGDWYKMISETIEKLSVSPWVLLLLTSVCAPILEELLFRGILLRALLNHQMNPYKAIVISSIAFGVIHGNPWQFVGATLLGLVIGLVYWKTESLSNAVLLHFVNNLSASLLLLYFGEEEITKTFGWEGNYVFILSLIALLFFGYLFINKKTRSY